LSFIIGIIIDTLISITLFRIITKYFHFYKKKMAILFLSL